MIQISFSLIFENYNLLYSKYKLLLTATAEEEKRSAVLSDLVRSHVNFGSSLENARDVLPGFLLGRPGCVRRVKDVASHASCLVGFSNSIIRVRLF